MSSTFLGLNTAYTGLQASNAALNTTANNIANAETKGFSRQEVTTQAAEAIRSFTTYGSVGAGVETISIERIRDDFYDQKYWSNQTKLGEYESKQYYSRVIEQYYTDDDSVNGFTTVYEKFYDSVQELSKNAGDTTYRQQMIGQGQNLATYFNDMYTAMQKLQSDVNQEIKVQVDRINSISEEIAALNKQINVIEMNTGAMANELRDQRDLLIDDLSEIVDVEVSETPIIDMNDPERKTGGNRFMVKICGQDFIDGKDYKTLTCVVRSLDHKINQSDVDGLFDIYFTGADNNWTDSDYLRKGDFLNIYGSTAGGKLAGLLQVRDGNNGEGFDGSGITVSGVERSGGETQVTVRVLKNRVTDAGVPLQDVNAHLTDLNKLNLSQDGTVLQIGGVNYWVKPEWTYNYEEGKTCEVKDDKGNTQTYEYVEYTFTLNDEKNIVEKKNGTTERMSDPSLNASVSIGRNVNYQGIPYYMSQMNEWVRMYAQATNNIYHTGVTDDGLTGIDYFNCEDNSGDAREFTVSYELTDGADNISVKSSDDSYYQLTAGNFQVNEKLVADADLLATRKLVYEDDGRSYDDGLYEGISKYDVITDIIDLKTNKNKMEFRGCASDQYLVCVLSDVALNANRANNFTDNYTYLQNSIQNQRLSVSGVDNDEEAVNLTKFQQGYNMASKMIQVLTEIYDRLILQTGV
ncbi:MAG: flagellar hook-associated protein FlgK [Lachnospiraceae bacterium]|nr:flagellar hook-associated protein FlgK [Lachnospiraceae bacterium]